MTAAKIALPRNTTRQADDFRYGNIARLTNRITGMVIVAFVFVHVIVQAITSAAMFDRFASWRPGLYELQQFPIVHAVLFFCIAFHTLWGLKLFLGDMGYVYHYKTSLFVVSGISLLFALWELLAYVGF